MPRPSCISRRMARDTDIARSKILDGWRVALHEPLAETVAQKTALAARSLADEDAQPANAGGMKLHKFHVL